MLKVQPPTSGRAEWRPPRKCSNAGVDPWDTAKAHFKRADECLALSDAEDCLSEEEGRLAHLFDEAEEAALAACCEGRDEVPPDSYFQLLRPPGG